MPAYTVSHWGVYQVKVDGEQVVSLEPFDADPEPSPIGLDMLAACQSELRVWRPAVRRSWLTEGPGQRPELRGREPFVEVSWQKATSLVAQELKRVSETYGNNAIFGGSYGWSSAGRFHHAQSHVHRFLNCIGGYVRSVDSYSLGAARVIMPHIVASMDELIAGHTSWNVLAEHTKLFVSLGGLPFKNAQVTAGGAGEHGLKRSIHAMRDAGVRFVNISPDGNDLNTGAEFEWIAIRPNTDCALLLGLAYVLMDEKLADQTFLDKYTVGFEVFAEYLSGRSDMQPKDPRWAAAITGVAASRIVSLAREMASTRTMINSAWSLQRAHHGEQPYWMLVTLAAMLGQIGLPGGGFGVGYGAINMVGNAIPKFSGPTFPQGNNKVTEFIPVARVADMLLNPGAGFSYDGGNYAYPDIRLIYWAGGNPFHHHQDLNRMLTAWKKPDSVIVHEQFWTPAAKMADVVLPATTTLERDDIGYATRERFMVSMKAVIPPVGEARDDYDIFADIANAIGVRDKYTEGLNAAQWQKRIYEACRPRAQAAGVLLPAYDEFLQRQILDLSLPRYSVNLLAAFRRDPELNALKTESGKIEIFSKKIQAFGYADCAGHARWYEPIEWLGSPLARRFPLHLLSDQPRTKLHSQLDHSSLSKAGKIADREPITLNPVDAEGRGIRDGDLVRVWNGRGTCIASASISEKILRGVVKLSTGAWFDPLSDGENTIEKHGNPNTLTLDIGASQLSQGCIAQTCLVEVRLFEGIPPAVTAFQLPQFVALKQ